MKKVLNILAATLLLNGCAFNDLLGGFNDTLGNTNKVLAGDLSPLDKSQNNATSSKKTNNSIDCEQWIKQAKEWDSTGKDKVYSTNAYTQVKIQKQKLSEISKIKYNIIYNSCLGYHEPLATPNQAYMDKVEIEEAQKKINAYKGKK